MKKVDLKIALLLSLFCFVAGFFVVPYQMQALEAYLSPSELKEMIGEQTISIGIISLISSLQLFLISLVLAFGGIKLARKNGACVSIIGIHLRKRKKSHFPSKAVLPFSFIWSDHWFFAYRL